VGDAPYPLLAGRVEALATANKPGVIIRNGTWFGPIDLKVPTISLIQDIMPANSYQRAEQVRVARQSALTVFNSAYTKSKYPELANITSRVIPLSVDFDLFSPRKVSPLADICWIGAASWVKGWDVLGEIIRAMPTRTFALVLKDSSHGTVPDNVRVFNRISHTDLPLIILGCQVGLCTSREETQHLAGIEMAGCGLPVVAPNVGAYYSEKQGWNGWCMNRSDVSAIEWVMATACPPGGTNNRVREAVMAAGFTRDACKAAWKEAVAWTLNSAS
jgi:glycosyltransferase involved in cell wall biosynthesis